MVEGYIARIRAQLIRVVDGQHIPREPPSTPAVRTIGFLLVSVDIAIEELKPRYMQGFGDISPALATDLEGIAGELHGLVTRLDRYLAEGSGQDLQARLQRLEQAGNDLSLLSKIEKVVAERGLVEFRSTITSILDRAEDRTFEIAIFGRVSSGKSSLLNALLSTDALPVGVTPVTAVPVRILFGEKPSATITFAQAPVQIVDIARLGEFATEQQNPGNTKQVTRITITIPSPRLREGIAFVDTPGLGSLATRGADETRAYLPKCDLGIVLIDAGSTLNAEDLHTLLALQEAAIPSMVLLSKADLLTTQDCETLAEYVRQHIRSETGLEPSVLPVSVHDSHRPLLDLWFGQEILPLYGRSQELRAASLQRKIGSLRESVVSALRIQVRKTRQPSQDESENIRAAETRLRRATGEIAKLRSAMEKDRKDGSALPVAVASRAAARILKREQEEKQPEISPDREIHAAIQEITQAQGEEFRRPLEELARRMTEDLQNCAGDLGMTDVPDENEFLSLIRGMPVFDPGPVRIAVSRPGYAALLGKNYSRNHLEEQIAGQLKGTCGKRFTQYQKGLQEWAMATITRLGSQFETYAERYRAHAGRSLEGGELSAEETHAIEEDLILLNSTSEKS